MSIVTHRARVIDSSSALPSAARRALPHELMNLCRILDRPARASTPLLTSTPNGRTAAIASATLSAFKPPASMSCVRRASCAAAVQSAVAPVPLTGPSNSNRGRQRLRQRLSAARTTGITCKPVGHPQRRADPRHRSAGRPAGTPTTLHRAAPAPDAASLRRARCCAARRAPARAARCAVTCRFDGANTKPIASAPASTAASTASRRGQAADLDPRSPRRSLVVHRSPVAMRILRVRTAIARSRPAASISPSSLRGSSRVHQRRADQRDVGSRDRRPS